MFGWVYFFLICAAKPQMLEKKTITGAKFFLFSSIIFSIVYSSFSRIIAYTWICFSTNPVLFQHKKAKPEH